MQEPAPATHDCTLRPRHISRREWLAVAAAGVATAPWPTLAAPRRRGTPLGFDNFAVHAMHWNARQLIDHAERLHCDSLFLTDDWHLGEIPLKPSPADPADWPRGTVQKA